MASPVTMIRATHHYGFRSGEWAKLITTVSDEEGRECYLVEFEDGVTDFWPVHDPSDPYEFSPDAKTDAPEHKGDAE